MAVTLEQAATNFYDVNQHKVDELLEGVELTNQYKSIEGIITPAMLKAFGNKTDSYIKKNDLVWALINACNNTEEFDLDF